MHTTNALGETVEMTPCQQAEWDELLAVEAKVRRRVERLRADARFSAEQRRPDEQQLERIHATMDALREGRRYADNPQPDSRSYQ